MNSSNFPLTSPCLVPLQGPLSPGDSSSREGLPPTMRGNRTHLASISRERVLVPIFTSPQKRQKIEEAYCRLSTTKHLYSKVETQDGHVSMDNLLPTGENVVHSSQYEGCLHTSLLQKVPVVYGRPRIYPVHSSSFWAINSTQSVLQKFSLWWQPK